MKAGFLYSMPIATRMVVTALIIVIVILPLAGGLLFWNLRGAVNSAFNERLESLLNVVIAGISYDQTQNHLGRQRQLGDPRFDRVFSGWYWQVRDDGDRVLTSRSLWDQRLPHAHDAGLTFRDIAGPREEPLRLAERDIRLPGLGETLHVSVAADLTEVDAQVARFGQLLAISLVTLGALLLLLIWLQVRWGLAPLRRIERSLRAVEQGALPYLDTRLPEELARLASAINTVLERDQHLIERGRTAAGNLAHALKTPLAVLTTLAERLPEESRAGVEAELRRLDEAVRHHLARASAAGPVSLGRTLDLVATLEPVVTGVARLAERRGLRFTVSADPAARLNVDPQDLQEMVGNLLENAVNWAHGKVELNYSMNGSLVTLTVLDDGPGMSQEEAREALNRGMRLDQNRSGSGLGLAIVQDLVTLYGGSLTLHRATQGGLEVTVTLPVPPAAPRRVR